jgi:hypothetical protein
LQSNRLEFFQIVLGRSEAMKEQATGTNSPGPGNGNQVRPGSPGGQSESTGASERSRAFGEKARTSAIEKTEEAREKAEKRMQQGREKLAERVEAVGSALRAGGGKLEDDEMLSGYVESAAESVERLASYVRSTDLRDAVHDVEEFARRSPLLFFGGAFTVGLAAGRFLKSSASRSGGQRSSSQASFGPAERDRPTNPGIGGQRSGFERPMGIQEQPQPPRPTVPQPARPPSGEGPKFS